MRRSKIEIVNDMLKAIADKGGKIKPTHLLYKSNLSHKRLKTYLDQLKEKGLVREETEGKKKDKLVIALTEEGYKFLEHYQQLTRFTDAFGL